MSTDITISVAYDGFSIDFDGEHYWINQEDDPSEKLSKLFNKLGLNVTVEEGY